MPDTSLAPSRSGGVEEEFVPVPMKLIQPCKVKKILGQVGNSLQIFIESWDESPGLFTINKDAGSQFKEGDVIFVESEGPMTRIIRILKGEEAKVIWKAYEKNFIEVVKPQKYMQKQQIEALQKQQVKDATKDSSYG
jgi:hypothetical protein